MSKEFDFERFQVGEKLVVCEMSNKDSSPDKSILAIGTITEVKIKSLILQIGNKEYRYAQDYKMVKLKKSYLPYFKVQYDVEPVETDVISDYIYTTIKPIYAFLYDNEMKEQIRRIKLRKQEKLDRELKIKYEQQQFRESIKEHRDKHLETVKPLIDKLNKLQEKVEEEFDKSFRENFCNNCKNNNDCWVQNQNKKFNVCETNFECIHFKEK